MRPPNTRPKNSLCLEPLEERENPAPIAFTVQSDGDDQLYRIDLATGLATPVGFVGFADVEGIAFNPLTNVLYGVDDATQQLITINVNTGAGTAVGSLGLPSLDVNPGLRFDNFGNLFMSTDFAGTFYQIDVATGAATALGNQGLPIFGLAFQNGTGTMYGLGDTQLATVNTVTGAATVVGPLTNVIGTQGDIDFDPFTGVLWGISDGENGPAQTFVVDPVTGIATVVASTLTGFESLAIPFVPPGPPPPPPGPPTPVVNIDNAIVVGAGAGGGPNVRIFNATTGELIRSFLAYDPTMMGGVNVAVGDVTGDGFAEIITAPASLGGSDIRVFDANGNLLYNFIAYDGFFGGASVGVGDVDGDGIGDIITGAGAGGGPHVRVFHGGDFNPFIDFLAYDPRFREGIAVAGGDFDGNGRSDIITGPGPGGGADVRIFRDGNFQNMQSFLTQSPLYRGGLSVAAGDVDGDGRMDLILGTGQGEPIVTVSDVGNTLTMKRQIIPYGRFEGGTRVGVFSRSDNITDITTGAGPGGGPHVRIISGLNGQAQLDLLAFDEDFAGGANVSVA